MIPRIFEGQRVFIVAGGPSLNGFDFSRLSGRRIIAINRSFEVLPHAQVLWWSDANFWRRRKAEIAAHMAPYKATCQIGYAPKEYPEDYHCYRFTGLLGFDPDPACLRHGNNSAFAAIHLAVHLGAREIVLMGVDMKHGSHGRTHWHDGHGTVHLETTLIEKMLPNFKSLAGPLAERGIEVINANPDSALTVWPRRRIEDLLR